MFCSNCGTQLEDNALFCHNCGAHTDAQERTPVKPKEPKKFPKKLIPILACILALVLVVSIVGTIFAGPSGKLALALTKSGKAFYSAAESSGLAHLGSIATMKDSSLDYDLWINKFDGSTDLKGLGIRGFIDTGISHKKITMQATPYFGSADLVNLQVKLDGDKLYAGAPELTKDTYYMINTSTIGKDVENLFNVDEISDLSFNLFDVISEIEKINSGNAHIQKDITKAFRTFVKEIEVDKDGTETVEVNDQDLKCSAYHVTVTEDSLENLVDSLQDIYGSIDNTDAYLDLLESIGTPDELISEIEYVMEDGASETDVLFDDIADVIDELGDVELDMYVHKGYVVAIVYEADDSNYPNISIQIGGGKNYVDDITVQFESNGSTLSFAASGNHICKGGQFTSEVQVKADRITLGKFEIAYEPKAKEDNFSLKLSSTGFELKTEGQLQLDKDTLAIRIEKLKLDEENSIGIDFNLHKYGSDRIKVQKSENLGQMSQDELYEVFTELGENATELLEDLVADIPALMYIF